MVSIGFSSGRRERASCSWRIRAACHGSRRSRARRFRFIPRGSSRSKHGWRRAPPFLKLSGSGPVALPVSSEPARFEVEQGQPLAIAARAVVAHGGEVLPELLAESDPLSGLGAGASMRFSGTGFVLADAR